MTDLEITKLCAEAMELDHVQVIDGEVTTWERTTNKKTNLGVRFKYDPLHDDAQAMALVKKFELEIGREKSVHPRWMVNFTHRHRILNRAICECVAKMQQARGTG